MAEHFGTKEKLDRIKNSYVALFEEMVHPSTTDERRSMLVGEIHALAELTRLEMVMSNATELILADEEQ